MYEHSYSSTIKNLVVNLCNYTGWSKVTRVVAKIGGLRTVNPELMSFIFAGITKDTPAEGAILSVMMIPVTMHCFSCGRIGTRDDEEIICPYCGSQHVLLLSGREFGIEFIEVDSNFYDHDE